MVTILFLNLVDLSCLNWTQYQSCYKTWLLWQTELATIRLLWLTQLATIPGTIFQQLRLMFALGIIICTHLSMNGY